MRSSGRPRRNGRIRCRMSFSVAMAADWGTGLYGAPKIAETMRKMAVDQRKLRSAMHLGDVYYSGTEEGSAGPLSRLWPTDAGRSAAR